MQTYCRPLMLGEMSLDHLLKWCGGNILCYWNFCC